MGDPVKEEKLDFSTHPEKINPTKTFLTLQAKGQLIQESNSGMKNKELCDKYGLNKSTVSKILKNQSRILTTLNTNGSSKLKACRDGKFPELEIRLYDWVPK